MDLNQRCKEGIENLKTLFSDAEGVYDLEVNIQGTPPQDHGDWKSKALRDIFNPNANQEYQSPFGRLYAQCLHNTIQNKIVPILVEREPSYDVIKELVNADIRYFQVVDYIKIWLPASVRIRYVELARDYYDIQVISHFAKLWKTSLLQGIRAHREGALLDPLYATFFIESLSMLSTGKIYMKILDDLLKDDAIESRGTKYDYGLIREGFDARRVAWWIILNIMDHG